MKKFIAIIALLTLFPGTLFACSMVISPEFHLRGTKLTLPAPPHIEVGHVNFVPGISHDGSCDGMGFIAIEIAGLSTRKIKNYGFLVKAASGVNDKDLFPPFPLAITRTGQDRPTISWAWTGITPDPDGHVRWTLEITPVSRSGVLGPPVTVCAASDGSCPVRLGDKT